MKTLRLFAFSVAALCTASAYAQAPAKAPEAPFSPGLAALVQPRAAELRAAGVKQIIARTGKSRRDIQALTTYGPVYLPWPKNAVPVPFEIYFNTDGNNAAFANDFSDATRAKFSAALDAIVPQVIKGANQVRANATRPKH